MHNASLDYPPEVLRSKARDFAAKFGYVRKPADSAVWLQHRGDLLKHLRNLKGPKKWREWLAAQAPISAVYREGLSPLAAPPLGEISKVNPAPIQPGMVEIEIDGHGTMRSFAAAPYATNEPPGAPFTAEDVFRSSGLDRSKFTETAPVTVPRSAADQFQAWRGSHPVIPHTEMTVEIGSWKGRLTCVNLVWPWTQRPSAGPENVPLVNRIRGVLQIAAISAGLIIAILLARRNWRLGRADRRGALRVAIVVILLSIVLWVCRTHPASAEAIIEFLPNAVADALYGGALFWILYMALEPAVRSRWPHSIVTWNRLLKGQWRDPQVSAHILIGAAMGVGLITAIHVRDAIAARSEGLDVFAGLGMVTGTRGWAAGLLQQLMNGVASGLIIFFLVIGLRAVLRKDWIAAPVGALFFTLLATDLLSAPNVLVRLSVYLVLYGFLIFSLLRFGLVVTISMVFFINMANGIVLGTDWSTWSAPYGIATIALILGLVLAAFRQSLGGRDLIGGGEAATAPR